MTTNPVSCKRLHFLFFFPKFPKILLPKTSDANVTTGKFAISASTASPASFITQASSESSSSAQSPASSAPQTPQTTTSPICSAPQTPRATTPVRAAPSPAEAIRVLERIEDLKGMKLDDESDLHLDLLIKGRRDSLSFVVHSLLCGLAIHAFLCKLAICQILTKTRILLMFIHYHLLKSLFQCPT